MSSTTGGAENSSSAAMPAGLVREAFEQLAGRRISEHLRRPGTLKHSLDAARSAVRAMMDALIARLGSITSASGGRTSKLGHYFDRIRAAQNLSDISDALGDLLGDTRTMHGDMTRTRGELQDTQDRLQAHEARVRELEAQLADLSQRIGEDPLTEALNRRGLDQQYAIEEARVKRKSAPLCVAVLDIDNFKQLNDQYGHAVGDDALKHLVDVVRHVIRPTDCLARYGGEEFVILLPETNIENAEKVMIRVQRELTKRFFLHDNERVLITFSAGVAERREGETRQQIIDRADRAMYRAKRAGKNRVECAN